MPSWTPKLTNVKGTDGTTTSGRYSVSDGVATFTAMIVARAETFAASSAGFGLTLPVPAATGLRTIVPVQLDGRGADHGVWTGDATVYSGSDGKTLDRIRTTGTTNGAALQNITHLYGGADDTGEVITVTGSYPVA
ncbi:hypothetical protein ACIQ9R_36100 [Streptomyces sp. NPDC094447]|uniref:hypothetical protein n=1 Tax=Streptomyces sp. NPDC094447 TaxID=3366062 RepID=UPI0037F6D03B